MAITQSGTATTQINSTAGVTANPSIPASLTTAHYMVLVVCVSGNKTASMTNPPAGWTTLLAPANNSTSLTIGVWGKFWAAGDTAPSVTWTSSNKNVSCIVPFLGVSATTQMDVAASSGTGTSTTPTSPTLTAATMGAARLHIGGRAGTGTSTPDSRMVEAVDITSTSTSPAALAFDYELGMANGALGTRADTVASAAWVAATIWLRPATPTTFGLLQSKQYTSSAISETHTATFPNALTSGSAIVAQVVNFNPAETQSTVKYGGSALSLTKDASAEETSTNLRIDSWYYQNNASTTADTVTVTLAGGVGVDCAIIIYEIAGAATTGTPVETEGIGTNTGTAVSATSGTTGSGQRLALMYFTPDATEASITQSASYVNRGTNLSGTHMAWGAETREFAGGGTENATATLGTSGEWVATLIILKPPAVGGFTPVERRLPGIGRVGSRVHR